MISSSSRRCWATIDLAALERNIGRIRCALPSNIKYISVVKADAYGHGLPQVVPRLMQSFIDCFAVATVHEAVTIRELGAGWPILVLSPVLPEEDPFLAEYNLMPTVSSSEELHRFEALGKSWGKKIPFHLKVDTGMGRAGIWHSSALCLFKEIFKRENTLLNGMYTHFASAGEDPDYTHAQRKIFSDLFLQFQNLGHLNLKDIIIHADNSAGLETFDSNSCFNAIRLGIIQFGILPDNNSWLGKLGIEPVLTLKTRVGLLKNLPKDATVSYGRTCTLERNSRIALITAGYGDGIPRDLSNRGTVIIRGQRAPIIGRVTMDQTIVDVSDLPEVSVGDEVTLIGQTASESISISEWSNLANTIEWDIYCSISKRVPRNYLNNPFS